MGLEEMRVDLVVGAREALVLTLARVLLGGSLLLVLLRRRTMAGTECHSPQDGLNSADSLC